MMEGYVKIEVPFGTHHPPAFMIEELFNYLIGADSMPWVKRWRDRDAVTIYQVPKGWEDWWRFWLGVPKPTTIAKEEEQ